MQGEESGSERMLLSSWSFSPCFGAGCMVQTLHCKTMGRYHHVVSSHMCDSPEHSTFTGEVILFSDENGMKREEGGEGEKME